MFKCYKNDKEFERDRTIEQMSNDIEPTIKGFYVACANGECETCITKRWTGECHAKTDALEVAKAYYDEGYRKQNEVIAKFSKKVIMFCEGYNLFDIEYLKLKLEEFGNEIIGEKNDK